MSDRDPDEMERKRQRIKLVPLETQISVTQKINEKAGGQEEDCCPVCNTAKSFVVDAEHWVPLGQNEPTIGIGAYAPAYMVVCTNCGYMRLFNKAIMDKLIAEEPTSEES